MEGLHVSVDSQDAQKNPILWTQNITNEILMNLIL